MIKVLIVDDSAVVRDFLAYILSSDLDIQVIGTASNGEEAIQAVRVKHPDVVTMDINMPKMDGFEATRMIMETDPLPIVIVSASWDPKEVGKTFRAMEAGALAAVQKPVGVMHPDFKHHAKELIQTVKLMSEVKVIRRRPPLKFKKDLPIMSPIHGPAFGVTEIQAVAIGASTGGPPAIGAILSSLPENFGAPLLIVQHIAPGFSQGFADWLADSCCFPVKIAEQGESPLAGHAYVAPDHFHMGIGLDGRIALSDKAPENGLRPSVSHLFRSVAAAFGKSAVGVLLTGMGKDGANELKLMKEKGAITIAQDEASCVVYGMPAEAINIGAAQYVLPPVKIAAALVAAVNKKR